VNDKTKISVSKILNSLKLAIDSKVNCELNLSQCVDLLFWIDTAISENAKLRAEIKRLKEQTRWIPVSERLPTDCRMKLLAEFTNETMAMSCSTVYTVGWYDCNIGKWIYPNGVYIAITHYMDIPGEEK
jgi:hypothetical protein